VRPPREGDAEGVLAVMLARDVADLGHPDFTLEDLRADWATPGLDLARDAWVVVDAERAIVGSGLLLGDDALVYVHPEACGRGVGSELRRRAEGRARERGTAVLRQFVPAGNTGARALLLEAGYWPAQHYFRMRMPLADLPPPPALALRPFERERDELAVHALVQAAMGEIEGYAAETLETWRGQRIEKEGWDPSLWLVLEEDGEVVGAALGERWDGDVGYVDQLAVAGHARGRGLGRGLLLGLLTGFREAGLETGELSVQGANRGAARLYESIGMRSAWEAERWEKALGHD
jgi:ribosomal protein S18 acetylase RimI-like enzyme